MHGDEGAHEVGAGDRADHDVSPDRDPDEGDARERHQQGYAPGSRGCSHDRLPLDVSGARLSWTLINPATYQRQKSSKD
ncbi:hypothetical protein GCM10009681_53840 [Luedemannella helvata]|uniref:Uncharacterized protein n=1 Tax=Luedemannella helvata TaxID=349315 RepID=A0ABN2L517_9ACTN